MGCGCGEDCNDSLGRVRVSSWAVKPILKRTLGRVKYTECRSLHSKTTIKWVRAKLACAFPSLLELSLSTK
eukprot:scaffold13318_cov193-Alexandrium_tamarense.AAC.13